MTDEVKRIYVDLDPLGQQALICRFRSNVERKQRGGMNKG